MIGCLALVLAAVAASGCYVPGGGWTLRGGLDLRTYRRPAVFTELVDTRWDEYNRVAFQNSASQGPTAGWAGSYVDPASGLMECPTYLHSTPGDPDFQVPQDPNSMGMPPGAPGVYEKRPFPSGRPIDESGFPGSSMPRMQTPPVSPSVPAPSDGPSARFNEDASSQTGETRRTSSSRGHRPQLIPSSTLDEDGTPTDESALWTELRGPEPPGSGLRSFGPRAEPKPTGSNQAPNLDEVDDLELSDPETRRGATLRERVIEIGDEDDIPMPTVRSKGMRERGFNERVRPASAAEIGQADRRGSQRGSGNRPGAKAGGKSRIESGALKHRDAKRKPETSEKNDSEPQENRETWLRTPLRRWLTK
jgi:hypothetical protein